MFLFIVFKIIHKNTNNTQIRVLNVFQKFEINSNANSIIIANIFIATIVLLTVIVIFQIKSKSKRIIKF